MSGTTKLPVTLLDSSFFSTNMSGASTTGSSSPKIFQSTDPSKGLILSTVSCNSIARRRYIRRSAIDCVGHHCVSTSWIILKEVMRLYRPLLKSVCSL